MGLQWPQHCLHIRPIHTAQIRTLTKQLTAIQFYTKLIETIDHALETLKITPKEKTNSSCHDNNDNNHTCGEQGSSFLKTNYFKMTTKGSASKTEGKGY